MKIQSTKKKMKMTIRQVKTRYQRLTMKEYMRINQGQWVWLKARLPIVKCKLGLRKDWPNQDFQVVSKVM